MTHGIRLPLVLALASFAGCALDEQSPAPPTEPNVAGEEDTGGRSPFVPTSAGFTAGGPTHDAVVQGGAIRMAHRPASGPGVEFATAGVSRAGAIDAAARGTTVQPDGSLAIDRGELTELVRNLDDGVEHSWRFEQAPAGDGDLVVDVRVSGHLGVRPTERGLYVQSGPRTGFHYSHATWVDATGARTAVPVAWTGDRIAIHVPAAVVDGAAYPAVLDPTIGGEGGVEPVMDGFLGARAREPSVAESNNRFLVVWRDDRSGTSSDIFAARVNPDGTLHDQMGFKIATTGADEGTPKVVWLDTGIWLVAWTVDDMDIAAATVTPNATVTQLGTIAGTAAIENDIDLAADGGIAMLVFASDGDIRGARYGAGTGFGATFDVATGASVDTNPAVTGSNGGHFLVAFRSGATNSDLRGQFVTRAGARAGEVFDISVDNGVQSVPAAAFDGTNYVVAWKSRPTEIWAARVDSTGAVLDMTGLAGGVAIDTGTTTLLDPDVSCDGTSCLISWEDQTDTVNLTTDVYGQRRAADFTVLGGTFLVNGDDRHQANVALARRNGGGWAAVYDDRAVGIHQVSLVRISGAGTVLDPSSVLVSRGTRNNQRAPRMAVSPVGQLAVWHDSRNFGDDIMALRYDAGGVRVDPIPGARVVSNAPDTQNAPAIDFDGTQYVVAWADTRNATFDVYAARYRDDGTNLDPGGIAISTATRNQTAPDVAGNGSGSLIVYSDRSITATRADIVGALMAPDGSFTTINVCDAAEDQDAAAIAWDPSSSVYVVAWADFRNGTDFDVYATRVQADGTVLDGCGVLVAGGAGDQRAPDVATSGTQALVVWVDFGADDEGDVRGARLTTAGALTVVDAGGIAIATGAGAQLVGTVAGVSGGRFSLAWEDWSNLATTGTDIYGNELSAAGTLFGPAYAISNTTEWEHGPHFRSGVNTTNETYVMYHRVKATFVTKAVRRRITHD